MNNLIDILSHRATEEANRILYTFLVDGETEECNLSNQQLLQKAKAIAVYLQSLCSSKERVLLVYPPGLDFIEAFFGCLAANIIAIPAYPPRRNRSFDRIQSIIKDAQPTLALTTKSILVGLEKKVEFAPELKKIRWLATDSIDVNYSQQWQKQDISEDNIAFLQYTSGSTSEPKGVKISHKNLLHNLKSIHNCFGHNDRSKGVIWLPPYHDMGLIGGILQPLYGNFPVVLMSPLMFLQNPMRWLKAISVYNCTTSGGPNFAYDLCVRKFKPESDINLDLSSWEVAFNGAEPINYETIEKFSATFAPYGFRKSAFYPCYGMAEATLIISGGLKSEHIITKKISTQNLEENKIREAKGSNVDSRILVSCGRSLSDQKVLIVNPDLLIPCESEEVGEIWVRGVSVAEGYWNKPEATMYTFNAYIAGESNNSFLRTGDLGFICDGELFVTGRLKDIIIINGRNHYPQDIERTVEVSSNVIRPNCSAVFAININGEESLVIMAEVERSYWSKNKSTRQSQESSENVLDLYNLIRRQVFDRHDLQPHKILFLKPGTIPKTSSGKIQRHLCREYFLENGLETLS